MLLDPTPSPPLAGVLATTPEISLPGGPTRVSVGGVGSAISDSVVCHSDELDMTLGALAQQIRSSVASGSSKQVETTPGDDVAAKTSSPRFSDFLPGFSQSFGNRISSPASKRGE